MSEMQSAFATLAGQQTPAGATPNPGNASPGTIQRPASAPASAGAGTPPAPASRPSGNSMLDAFSALAANPQMGLPPAPKEPGSFGPWDAGVESDLFPGPVSKGVMEGAAKMFGFHETNPTVMQGLSETWDNLVDGAKQTFQKLRTKGMGQFGETVSPGLAKDVAAGVATPAVMIGNGIEGMVKAAPQGIAMILDGLKNPGPDAEGISGKQRIGRGVGTILGLLGQVAVSEAASEAGGALKTGAAGDALEDMASGPGNAMVRARKGNYSYGKNPGDYLVDEPVKPPVAGTRLGQLENLHAQNVAHGNALHAQVNNLLQGANTIGAITPEGTVRTVPNLYDWASEVEDAADEVKRNLQGQSGAPSRAKIARAVNEMRDDILQNHDIDGNPTGAKPRVATPAAINDIKKSLGGRPSWKLITDPDAAEAAAVKDAFAKKAYGKLKDVVDNAVGGPAGRRVNDLNRRFSNAIEFRQLLEDEIAKEKGTGGFNALARKGEWVGAGTAIVGGHPWLGALLALNRMLRSVPGRVIAAKGLSAAGAALKSPGARMAGSAAGAAAASTIPVSAAAARTLAGEEGGQ